MKLWVHVPSGNFLLISKISYCYNAPEQASIQFNTHIGSLFTWNHIYQNDQNIPLKKAESCNESGKQKVSEFLWQVILKFIISFYFIKNQHGAPDNVHVMVVCRTSVTCESCK